jgi:hypothetical protein
MTPARRRPLRFALLALLALGLVLRPTLGLLGELHGAEHALMAAAAADHAGAHAAGHADAHVAVHADAHVHGDATHASHADAPSGHDHAHPHDAAVAAGDDGRDDTDPRHADGAHGLLHELPTPSATLPDVLALVAAALPRATVPLASVRSRAPGDPSHPPLRPPIA